MTGNFINAFIVFPPVGGGADKYLLEDGSGGYQLEDGSGNHLLE